MRSGSRCPAFYGEIPPMRWGILDDDGGYFYCITYSRTRRALAAISSDAQDALVLAQERDATFAPARSVTSLLNAVTKATLISSSVICHRHITHGAFGIYARVLLVGENSVYSGGVPFAFARDRQDSPLCQFLGNGTGCQPLNEQPEDEPHGIRLRQKEKGGICTPSVGILHPKKSYQISHPLHHAAFPNPILPHT